VATVAGEKDACCARFTACFPQTVYWFQRRLPSLVDGVIEAETPAYLSSTLFSCAIPNNASRLAFYR